MSLANLFGESINLVGRLEDILGKTLVKGITSLEKIIYFKIKRLKRKILFFMLELLMYSLSIILVLLAVDMFLFRFFPRELVLIITAFVLLYIALLFKFLG
jgi:hypothetical protein